MYKYGLCMWNVCAHVCVAVHRHQRRVLHALFYYSTYFLRHDLFMNLELSFVFFSWL